MEAQKLIEIIGSDFYTGVPDSQLKALCDYLMIRYGIDPKHHIIAANEGNCVGIASGYHLATGKVPVVYMQNSGEGNAINPIASLLSDEVYAIPMILIIGWRGEPGVDDEPQHIYQGKVTLKLLEDMDIEYSIIGSDTSEDDLKLTMQRFQKILDNGKSVALVVRKNAILYEEKCQYGNSHTLCREDVIRRIVSYSEQNPIISTTGKISRELYEIREARGEGHQYDFLTVGSMGHTSSIALGVALHKPDRKVWCIDGDGAMLMHLGAVAVIGNIAPDNMVHIVINNEAHETVGGMPTVASKAKLTDIAKACGYEHMICVDREETLDGVLRDAKERNGTSFIEIKCKIASRNDLGRPITTPKESKEQFMRHLST